MQPKKCQLPKGIESWNGLGKPSSNSLRPLCLQANKKSSNAAWKRSTGSVQYPEMPKYTEQLSWHRSALNATQSTWTELPKCSRGACSTAALPTCSSTSNWFISNQLKRDSVGKCSWVHLEENTWFETYPGCFPFLQIWNGAKKSVSRVRNLSSCLHRVKQHSQTSAPQRCPTDYRFHVAFRAHKSS